MYEKAPRKYFKIKLASLNINSTFAASSETNED